MDGKIEKIITRRRYETTKSVHLSEPDYERDPLEVPQVFADRFRERLNLLYGKQLAERYLPELLRICKVYHAYKSEAMLERQREYDPAERFGEEDVILITYGDILKCPGESPLKTLSKFLGLQMRQVINTIHILPFFPYSSDRGFSVLDFEQVDPKLGTWEDIEDLEQRYQLMFDGVFNHASARSRWFHEFLADNPYYREFFISYDTPAGLKPEDRSLIFRPRTSELLTEFSALEGKKYVWTTFSSDQVDLNYHNPNVLMRVIEILLLYIRRGADIIRLDAITFLWCEPGTSCIHLQQTHEVVKLLRDVLNLVAPQIVLMTETNVPHEENISYFGNGEDEAQMVYNFALPPLVLHTFYTEDATSLTHWAQTLAPPSSVSHFFNFLASHDGIGLVPVRGILSNEQIEFMVRRAREHGGLVSYKSDGSGGEVPYEINITWFSALNRADGIGHIDKQIRRYLASRSIALVLQGIPGIYFHSLFGTQNDLKAVMATGSNREINRSVVDFEMVQATLEDPESSMSKIMRKFTGLIMLRTRQPAFHPRASQQVLELSEKVFSLVRRSPKGEQVILTLVNIADARVDLSVSLGEIGLEAQKLYDLISKEWFAVEEGIAELCLEPYAIFWLEPYGQPG